MAHLPDEEIARDLRAEARSLFGFVSMLVGDRDRAEDLFQETCLEAWRARARFEAGRDFGRWLRGVARNVVLRDSRSRGRAPVKPLTAELMDGLEESWVSIEDESSCFERRVALRVCLGLLRDRDRELLRLRYNDHRSHRAIAEAVGRTVAAVKMRLSRLRRKLLDCLLERMAKARAHAR